MPTTVFTQAREVLLASTAQGKLRACEDLLDFWAQTGRASRDLGTPAPVPDSPARPERPKLVMPKDVARRRLGSEAGRIALLHAVAHIEFNAIDLAADMIARFGATLGDDVDMQKEFISDWLSVLSDEARHFEMVTDRLSDYGSAYGDLPAHNGLWDAAQKTSGDLAARLAIAPMVLEARGLDVTPSLIEKFKIANDFKSAQILEVIYTEEIGHVATGVKWFKRVAEMRKLKAEALFKACVDTFFKGELKPPFNHAARNKAGLTADFYT